jgi:hypothetical protein
MLRDPIEAEIAERDQAADCARIDAAIGMAKQDIAALEVRQLDPHEMRKDWLAIRDKTVFTIRDVRRNIVKRAHEAKETERWMVEQFLHKESDSRVIREFSTELQKVPTGAVVDYLRYLIQIDDVARIQSIRAVFAARVDHQRYKASFDRMLTQFAFAKCGELCERLARIYRLAENMDARVVDLFCTHAPTNQSCAPTSQRPASVGASLIQPVEIDAGVRPGLPLEHQDASAVDPQ